MLSRPQGLTVKSLFISMLYKRSRRSGIPALYQYHLTFGGIIVSRFLEYQLQLGSFSLNKGPTEVGTLNTV